MHEVSIALAIVDEISQRTAADPIEAITAVHLRLGALSSVVPEALGFAWELATHGTPAAGSRLEIEHVPLAIACKTCGCERTIAGSTLPICPVCGESSTEIVRGRELLITAMEVVYAAAADGNPSGNSSQEQHTSA